MLKTALLLMIAAGAARAEFLHLEVFMRDMSCESCSESLGSAIKRMRGVENVTVDFKAGTVAVELAPQNHVGVEQVWDAIKRVGFTPGETKVVVRGTVAGQRLEVPEIGKTFEIEGRTTEGQGVQLKGTIQPPPDPRTPIRIRVSE
jgi:copper chaperone CopZ